MTLIRRYRYFYITLLMCICYSCDNRPYPPTLIIADSLSNTNPDSAVSLLREYKDTILSTPKATQMYYQLLCIKANDKAYIPHTSDSLIVQLLHYYENSGDKKILPETYYYAGRVYRDLGDAPQALEYFQKAIEISENSTDYKLISRIYSQTGTLYWYQDMYDEAKKAFKKAYHFNLIAKDSTVLILNLRDIGSIYSGYNENIDSALYYYQKSYNLAKKLNHQRYMDVVGSQIANLYIGAKRYNLAKDMLQPSLNNIQRSSQSGIYSIAADLYYRIGNADSASYYYNLLLNCGSIYTKQTAHRRLAEIALQHSDPQTALIHITHCLISTDSIQKITITESIRKMQSMYNYQLREKENSLLKSENTRQKLWLTCILIIIVILACFIITYIQYNKRKKFQLNIQLRELKAIKEEQSCKNFQVIEEKEKREEKFRLSTIYMRFHQASVNERIHLTDNDWEELQEMIDRVYKGFCSRLYALYPVSDIELKICLLIKAGISMTGIAILTGRSKSAITSARKRLYEKVHHQKGIPERWDEFIQSL